MKLLEDRIRKDGVIKEGDVLKVDSFLNHRIDVSLLDKIGEEIYRLFKDKGVNKILTVEASGIAVACMAARYFDCPVVFAKKSRSSNISDSVYSSPVISYTHGCTNNILVSREFLSPEDRVLLVDDFLARGQALIGLADIVKQAGAEIVGAAAVIEKAYQGGGDIIKSMGIELHSLARIKSMSVAEGIEFC